MVRASTVDEFFGPVVSTNYGHSHNGLPFA